MLKRKDETSACMEECGCPYKAGHKAREVVQHAVRDVRNAHTALEQRIQREPIRTTALIAGLAYMLGKLRGRR